MQVPSSTLIRNCLNQFPEITNNVERIFSFDNPLHNETSNRQIVSLKDRSITLTSSNMTMTTDQGSVSLVTSKTEIFDDQIEFENALELLCKTKLNQTDLIAIDIAFKEFLRQKNFANASELLFAVINHLKQEDVIEIVKPNECSEFTKQLLSSVKLKISKAIKTINNPIDECFGKFYDLMQAITHERDLDSKPYEERLYECAIELVSITKSTKKFTEKDLCLNFLEGAINLLPLSKDLHNFHEKLETFKHKKNLAVNKNTTDKWHNFWPNNHVNHDWKEKAKKNSVWDQWCTFAMNDNNIKEEQTLELLKIWAKALPLAQYIAKNSPIELVKRSNMKVFLRNAVVYPNEIEAFYKSLLLACVDYEKKERQRNQKLPEKITLLLKTHLEFCDKYRFRRTAFFEIEGILFAFFDRIPKEAYTSIYSTFLHQLENRVCHSKLEKMFLSHIKDFSKESIHASTLLQIAQVWRNHPTADSDKFMEVAGSLSKLDKQEAIDEALHFIMQSPTVLKASDTILIKDLITKCSSETRDIFYYWILKTPVDLNLKFPILIEILNIELLNKNLIKIASILKEISKREDLYKKMKDHSIMYNLRQYGLNNFENVFKKENLNLEEIDALFSIYKAVEFTDGDSRFLFASNLIKFNDDSIRTFQNLLRYIRENAQRYPTETQNENGLDNPPFVFCSFALEILKCLPELLSYQERISELISTIHYLNVESLVKVQLFKEILTIYLDSKKYYTNTSINLFEDKIFWKLCFLSCRSIDQARESFPEIPEDIKDDQYSDIKFETIHNILKELIFLNIKSSLNFAIYFYLNKRHVELINNIDVFLNNVLELIESIKDFEYEYISLAHPIYIILICLMGDSSDTYRAPLTNWYQEKNLDPERDISWISTDQAKKNCSKILDAAFNWIFNTINKSLNKYSSLPFEEFKTYITLIGRTATFLQYFNFVGFYKDHQNQLLKSITDLQNCLLNGLEKYDIKFTQIDFLFNLLTYLSEIKINQDFFGSENYVDIWITQIKIFQRLTNGIKNKNIFNDLNLSKYFIEHLFALRNLEKAQNPKSEKFLGMLQEVFQSMPQLILKLLGYLIYNCKDLDIQNYVQTSKIICNIIKQLSRDQYVMVYYIYPIFLYFLDEKTKAAIQEKGDYLILLKQYKNEPMKGIGNFEDISIIREFVQDIFHFFIYVKFPDMIGQYLNNINKAQIEKLFIKHLKDLIYFLHYFGIHKLYESSEEIYLDNIMHLINSIKVFNDQLELFNAMYIILQGFSFFSNVDLNIENQKKLCLIFNSIIDWFNNFLQVNVNQEIFELINNSINKIIVTFVEHSHMIEETDEKKELLLTLLKWQNILN